MGSASYLRKGGCGYGWMINLVLVSVVRIELPSMMMLWKTMTIFFFWGGGDKLLYHRDNTNTMHWNTKAFNVGLIRHA